MEGNNEKDFTPKVMTVDEVRNRKRKERERRRKERKAEGKRSWATFGLTLVLLLGLAIVIYPSFSNWWNSRVQSRAMASYDEAVSSMSEADYSEYFEAAYAYNEAIAKLGSATSISNPGLIEGYSNILNVSGTGVMGYITIEKIGVELPIYHGTSASVLQIAAGHLEGTSLPVGGESTHAVISAHRGLPSATLFTHLDQMEVGDTFTITILNEVLTYEVDQISIIYPNELETIYIEDGQDYVTLMTCTPYGINTQRLMVRGHRIETEAAKKTIKVTAEAYKIDTILVSVCVAIPMVIILFIIVSLPRKKKYDGHRKP
ncbi:MAG: class C sortase [Oscillospiraceae bacterium]|nr:class C sortase [Ruminococcus sp.]MCD8344522.1 class C sortase [Oscillospiraceae bacterium]